jgi:hypothetical protein
LSIQVLKEGFNLKIPGEPSKKLKIHPPERVHPQRLCPFLFSFEEDRIARETKDSN